MSPLTETWTPPRGAVTVTQDTLVESEQPTFDQQHPLFTATCSCCHWSYGPALKSDARQQKSWHRCPAGTIGAYPTCPVCGSASKRCKRPSGHEAAEWHVDRTKLYQRAVGA